MSSTSPICAMIFRHVLLDHGWQVVNCLVVKADGGTFVYFCSRGATDLCKGLVNDQHHGQVLQTIVTDVA